MMSENTRQNPFHVLTPESLSASEAVDLFVEVPDFRKIYDLGHTMLNGPRGSGKSMLFRYLMPDCQMRVHGRTLDQLPFFAVLVSIKNTYPNLTELRRLADSMAQVILSEHALTSYVAASLFKTVRQSLPDATKECWIEPVRQLRDEIRTLLLRAGMTSDALPPTVAPEMGVTDILNDCADMCDNAYLAVSLYAKRIAFEGSGLPYNGPLCDYLSFLYPIIESLQALPFFPSGPTYLLIDDADYLTQDQTRVLNSWLTTRTQHVVNIKVSTQNTYKTLATVNGLPIRSPHDFQEINIADIYTTRHGTYQNNVREILHRRLARAEIDVDLPSFFPKDEDQEAAIAAIENEIRVWWELGFGRGNRVEDDVMRYARPTYMKRLAGTSKSSSSYSYAGFNQLIHLSSGQVRYVLHPAAMMYDEQRARNSNGDVQRIDPSVQNAVQQRCSEDLMYKEFDDLVRDPDVGRPGAPIPPSGHPNRVMKLRNLVAVLGGIFRRKLLSDDAERRVFSAAISGDLEPDVEDIFELGVAYGYFHKSSIGNKEGTGRTRLYIMSRRLAPHFRLDPSSFAGYQFITCEALRSAMRSPSRVLTSVRQRGIEEIANPRQRGLDL